MSYTIRVAGSEIAFGCGPETTILDAAQAAGYAMPYSCRSGVCGSCKGRVAAGQVAVTRALDGVSAAERNAGYTLLCQAKPRSDLEIVPRQIERVDPNARKLVNAKVYRVERPADDVAVLQLRFPAGTRVKFKAGQYLQVVLDDGERRSFSMANPPQQSDGAQLHVRVVPGGRFSEQVLPGLSPGKALRVELPHGDFFLREASSRPAVFVASGTGFAPIKSILEDAFRRGVDREMVLYWGARKARDLYLAELPAKWAAERPKFRFVPVLSEADPADGWTGRAGFVHKAVMEDFPTLAGHEVYACGVPAMINAARRDFEAERGLPPEDFHCDAFVTPADVAGAGR
jgi:NAD(P)H-flavin reductase/ferredoxin